MEKAEPDVRTNGPGAPPEEPAPRKGMSCLMVLSLAVAVPFYLISILLLVDIGSGDAHSRGLAQGLSIVAQLVMWVPLGLVVLVCVASARLPGWIATVGVTLVLAGAAAAVTAIGMMSRPGLLAVPPVVLPLLALLFGMWARTQAPSGTRARNAAIAFTLVAAPLIAGPFIAYGLWVAGAPEREAEWARMTAEQERQARVDAAAEEARFRALGPQSRLDDALPFLQGTYSEQALALIPTLNSGPADAARLLDGGMDLYEFERLHEFGLEMRPDLCRTYHTRLDARLREGSRGPQYMQSVVFELQSQLPNLRWFMTQGCDLSAPVRNLAVAVRMLPADYGLQDYAGTLDAILRLRQVPAGDPQTAP